MVMPLTGFDELPIRPLMRDATVTNKNPKTTTKIAAIKFAKAPVCAPGIGLNFSSAHIIAMITTEPTTTTRMDRSRSVRLRLGKRRLLGADVLHSRRERRENCGQRFDQRDQSGGAQRRPRPSGECSWPRAGRASSAGSGTVLG